MTRSSLAPGLLAAVLLVLAVAACTGDAGEAGEPTRGPSSRTSTTSTAPTVPLPESPPTDGPTLTQPLVIVMHATAPPLDVTSRVARRVLSGSAQTWSDLGASRVGTGGQDAVRVVAAPDVAADAPQLRSARAALRAVVRDPNTIAVVPATAAGPQVQAVRVDGVDPFLRPDRYPLRTPAAEAPAPVVTMTVVGDIMLGRGVADAARRSGDPVRALRPMQRRLASADLTVANLESTLSRAGAPTQGGDSFAADPVVAQGLRDAGFDVLSLANNHLGDFGDQALVQTVRRLRDGGLRTFGAGRNPRAAWQPGLVVRSGVRFGFLGFNAIGETPEVGPGQAGAVSVSMPPRTGPLDRAELDRFLGAVRRLDRRVDVVVVLPHWGTQYTNVPEPVQHRVARRLVASGADLVVGGHPHWVQGAEMVDARLVVHSLGNFVFDMDFMEETLSGLMLEVTFWGPDVKAARFVPYAMDATFAPRVQSYNAGIDTLRLMWRTSGPAFSR